MGLPVERSLSIFNFKQLPIAFLGSIVLFFIIQSMVEKSETFWRFCYFFSDPLVDDAIRLEAQLRTISPGDEQKTIFLTGSSQTREDFDVDYLNREFKKAHTTFYSLGVSGNASPIEMFMLKEKLLARKPEVLIYVPFVGTFYSSYDFRKMKYYFNPVILPYLVKYVGIKNILTHPHLRTYFIDSFLGRATIFYQYRESIGRILLRAMRHYTHIERQGAPERYAYKTNKPRAYFEREIKKARESKYRPTPYTALSKSLFTLFAKHVIAQGVKLIVVTGPVHPLIKMCYKREIDADYEHFLSGQAHNLGFVYLPESQLPSFKEEEFVDFTHLNASGRKRFSRFIKSYLSQGNNPSS